MAVKNRQNPPGTWSWTGRVVNTPAIAPLGNWPAGRLAGQAVELPPRRSRESNLRKDIHEEFHCTECDADAAGWLCHYDDLRTACGEGTAATTSSCRPERDRYVGIDRGKPDGRESSDRDFQAGCGRADWQDVQRT